ncbi:RxLR-like protein [Plasmopara halstedii]|uniref:RxLR-like protein n=1 Tax=Plasmopara halstedii TaxID=4781 RepID=A0A0P1AIE6_PLAHL|nr:RxLR-like protein [Plasmopara halstedii]CEG40534.1 RxLR-like protein [Plasmopara halstedii]|eukprot:XP_024576903.1 RxLR-like protein [Plasmopara halstedii]
MTLTRWTAVSILASGALCAAAGAWLGCYLLKVRQDRLQSNDPRVKKLEQELERQKRLRAQERAGRTNAERGVRRALQKLQELEGYNLQAVAHVQSCFADRRGTPRQGGLVRNSRARIKFKTNISPASFESLEQFSHMWVLFIFHKNTNLAKTTTKTTFPAKIAPPRLGGKKVGIFSTRTPHRPNSIGLSVVKIEAINDRCIEISGHDLVNGTPVLDVKPYVPADSVPGYVIPDWVAAESDVTVRKVEFTPEATATLIRLVDAKVSSFYSTMTDFKTAIEQVLVLDIRSVYQGRGQAVEAQRFNCRFDSIQVEFMTLDNSIRVISCSKYTTSPEACSLEEEQLLIPSIY